MTSFNEVHCENIDLPRNFTFEGITTFLINLHSQKAYESIDVTDDGISISSKDWHKLKLLSPNDVNDVGNFMCLIFSQKKNPCVSIDFNEGGNLTSSNNKHLKKVWLFTVVIDGGMHTFIKEEHSWKQNASIDVTDEGIEIYFKFVALQKAERPNLVTDGGI